jgi:hypothetical protein
VAVLVSPNHNYSLEGDPFDGLVVVSADPGTALVDQVWTGRITLVEIFEQGQVVEIIEIAARRDHVTVWKVNLRDHATAWEMDRTLAVMDRDGFRAWLGAGTGEYVMDDLAWTFDSAGLVMTVDGATRYGLRKEMATWLAVVM